MTAPPTSSVTTPTAAVGNTLLTYQLLTEPDPLTVSVSSDQPTTATLTFSVSCSRAAGSCTVSEIAVALPVGDASDSANLTPTAPAPDAASISSSDGSSWTPSAGIGAGEYTFTPPGGSVLVADQSLTITIVGIEMSTVVGTSDIVIAEWAAPGTGPAPPPTQPPSGRATIAVAKFPAGFYAGDFTSTTPDVGYGEPATLTWVGSANASFKMAYGEVEPFDVAGDSWTSGPLYDTTRFILTAWASEDGQTVELSFDTSVGVDSPQVVQFAASPSGVDVGQAVTLSWRAVNADGVYLYSGDTDRQTLPAVSDSQPLTPVYGVDYTLQAYQGQGAAQLTSPPWKLDFRFNPIRIVSFTADPASVDEAHPQTQVSWDVLGAASVALDGETVAATGSVTESPSETTTIYDLVATWVDGTTTQSASVIVPAAVVDVGYCQATIAQVLDQGVGYDITLTFQAFNLTGLTVSQATLLVAEKPEWNRGTHFEKTIGPVTGVQTGPTTWTASLFYWGVPYGGWKNNMCVLLDYTAQGWYPQTVQNYVAVVYGTMVLPSNA